MSLAILIPSQQMWHGVFARSVAELTAALVYNRVEFELYNIESSILPASRFMLMDMALQKGHTYALCLDSDMYFPGDIVPRLMAHDKDIIVANYVTRPPCRHVCHDMEGNVMQTAGKEGIEQASRIAIGCALIKLDAIRKLKEPYFEFIWQPDKRTFLGEDYYFSNLCTEAGIEMWVDHEVTKDIGHMGYVSFTYKNA